MRAASLSAIAATALLGFVACSLDLDEGLIGSQQSSGGASNAGSAGTFSSGGSAGSSAGGGAGGGAASGGTGGSSAGSGGSAGAPDAGGVCSAPTECNTSADACLVPTCTLGECAYELCPPIGCSARFCGVSSCEMSPTTYGFQAQQFSLGDSIGCGGNADACIAAFDNLLFVGSESKGVKAWDMSDPTSPRPVELEQPPFAISRLTATGARVVLQGPTSGGKLSLAWYDRPASPKATTLGVSTAGVNFTSAISATYPGAERSVFLVLNNASEFYPSALVTPPLANTDTVTLLTSSGIAGGARVVGSSGTRLVTFRTETSTGSFEPYFSFERSAGTAQAQNDGEVNLLGTAGEVPVSSGAHQFASGHDGSLLWRTNILVRDIDNTALATGVTLRWPVVDGAATAFDGAPRVDLETYPTQPYNTVLAGPIAWLNPTTAIATAADPANTSQTAVRIVKRAGSQLSVEPGRFVIPFSTGQIGVQGGSRFGYVLTPNGLAKDATIYVFAPGCN